MISDAALAELALLRRVLAGKDPREGLSRNGSAMSILRGGSGLAPSRGTQVLAHG